MEAGTIEGLRLILLLMLYVCTVNAVAVLRQQQWSTPAPLETAAMTYFPRSLLQDLCKRHGLLLISFKL